MTLTRILLTSTNKPLELSDVATESTDNIPSYRGEKRSPVPGKKGVFHHVRNGPSGSQLYIANADGTNATALMGDQMKPFDYHASWSVDGQWIVFTSERRGAGQSDIYRIRPDGSNLETLVSSDAYEAAGTLSPDGSKLAYVSTAINYTANVFVLDIANGISINVTGSDETVGNLASPHGFFRPAWSPDGSWIAMTSDRNTDWTGHSNGTGWEHSQELTIYLVKPDGSGFRKLISYNGYSLGTPKWSADGSRIVYNNMTVEATYWSHFGLAGGQVGYESDLYTVDFATGLDVQQLTSGEWYKIGASFIGNATDNIGYVAKNGPAPGIHYTSPDQTHAYFNNSVMPRNPSWSPDGTRVVYEVLNWTIHAPNDPLFSWDPDWEYRYMDVFPQLHDGTGRIALTTEKTGNGSAATAWANYTDQELLLDVGISSGPAGFYWAFQPSWHPDGDTIAVGLGTHFEPRSLYPGTIYLSAANGSWHKNLTEVNGTYNSLLPSFSPDGEKLVFRVWDGNNGPLGLHILDLSSGETTQLTDGWDTTPGWSYDGQRIVFTRQMNWTWEYGNRWYADRYDVCTISPDGTDFQVLTHSGANDAHAVWSHDGKIMYNSGMHGFRDECATYDNTFQPYGQILVMNADGSNKTVMTDSMWEDGMPLFVPNKFL
ncbi:hypothetical protein BX600DRAFT_484314 [Xylariales sp. PMI_506]|nr:hypothetical protein BX600DRAFT_484314 [Xylariales sp. PMI_506]